MTGLIRVSTVLFLALMGMSFATVAKKVAKPEDTAKVAKETDDKATAEAEYTPVHYDHAKAEGFDVCLPQLKEIGSFVVNQHRHTGFSRWSSKELDKRAFSSLIVKDYQDGDSHIATVTVRDFSGKCYVEYSEAMVFTKPCQSVRKEIFKDWKADGEVFDETMALSNEDGSAFAYLTDQVQAKLCLVTKREVVFY